MKTLICSDSHERLDFFQKIIDLEKPDNIIFAGDHSEDAINMNYIYEGINFFVVRGNTDFYDDKTDDNLLFELEGKKIFLTHGHLYGVKMSYNEIINKAKNYNADICIFGHTHIEIKFNENNIIFINPGALKDRKYVILENDKIEYKTI